MQVHIGSDDESTHRGEVLETRRMAVKEWREEVEKRATQAEEEEEGGQMSSLEVFICHITRLVGWSYEFLTMASSGASSGPCIPEPCPLRIQREWHKEINRPLSLFPTDIQRSITRWV